MVRNADITLYHKEYDPTKRIDVWTHAQYEGCLLYTSRCV